MFNFFKKNTNIYAPVVGKAVPLEEVPDKMFSEKLLGDGLAFTFQSNMIYAPCDGEIVMIAPTKHALGIKLPNDTELMIHIGLDTVNLGGEGFELHVKSGDKIKRGQELVGINQQFFREQGINLITPMIVTSSELKIVKQPVDFVDLNTIVMKPL